MRTIKFRAWDTYNKEMLEVQELDYADSYNGQPMVRTTMYNDYFDIEEMILMQFTGLHDKNGKEIYEGDIVKVGDVNTAIVDWNKEYASFVLKPIQDYYFDSDILGHAVYENEDIVIGNIYDNPELLERSSNGD